MSNTKKKTKKNQTKKSEKNLFKIFNLPFLKIVIYSILIFALAEFAIWFFNLNIINENIAYIVNYFGLDAIFNNAINSIPPDISNNIDVEKITASLFALTAWAWLIPFALGSFFIGSRFLNILRDSNIFITILKISIFICLFKLIECSIPFGFLTVITYFIDFLKKFYFELFLIFVTCYLFMYIGAEIKVFQKKNTSKSKN